MIKENKGQIVIEMCFIMPMVVGIIFLSLFIFIYVMNRAVAAAEVYTVLYTKEAYLIGQDDISEEEITSILQSEISDSLSDRLYLIQEVGAEVELCGADGILSSYADAGYISAEVTDSMECEGLFMLISDATLDDRIYGRQELRDTSNNLRRWQIYGKILQN